MADTEVIKVLFEIANPSALQQLENLRKGVNIGINTNIDSKLKEILSLRDKQINVKFGVDNVTLNELQAKIDKLSKPVTVNIKASDGLNDILAKMERAALLSERINVVGSTRGQISQLAQDPNRTQALGTFPAGRSQPSVQQVQSQANLLKQIKAQSGNDAIALQLQQVQAVKTGQGFVPLKPGDLSGFNATQASSQVKEAQASRDKARAAIQAQLNKEKNEFFSSVQPSVSSVNKRFDNNLETQRRERASQIEKERKDLENAARISSARISETRAARGDVLRETALGAIRGQGPLALGGSLLGGVAGAAFAGPGGAAIGSTFGGAIGEAAQKSLEGVARGLENVAEAGLEFQKTIVAISGVLQANTRVIGEDGKQLDAVETSKFNTARAREIQKAARSELLPLGIGGESEAQLVGGLISGFSQRGIILSPEETKTVSRRFGSAIVALAPQLLGNAVQLRRDSEDIAAGSPNAGRTTLGVALKNIAPDLFRTLASSQDVIKATERLEQFNQAIKNSDQASVQVLRLSGAIDKLRTTAGDALLQGLAPGIKALADAFSDGDLEKGIEGFFKQIGSLGAILIKAGILIADTISKLIEKIPFLKQLGDAIKGLAGGQNGGPNGTAIPNPDDVIKRILTGLGVEPQGIDKFAAGNANFRLDQLNTAEEKVDLSGKDLVSKFLPDILTETLKALDLRLQQRAGTFDTETFAGRRGLADFQSSIALQKVDTAQRGFDTFSKLAANEKDPAQAAIFEAVAQNFKNALDTAAQDAIKAAKDIVRANLDEVKTLQGLRNAQEQLIDVQKEQVFQLNDLNRSLQEAQDNLGQFSKKLNEAFASREEQIISASQELEKAGGISPLGSFTDEDVANAKKNSAAAKLNSLLGDSGIVGFDAFSKGDTGVRLPRTGSPFTNRLDAEEGKLADSVEQITDQLEKLPRALRDALEGLNDLIERSKLQFPDGKLPNIPSGDNPFFGQGVGKSTPLSLGTFESDPSIFTFEDSSSDLPSSFMQEGLPLQAGLSKDEVMPNYSAGLDINGNQFGGEVFDKFSNQVEGPEAVFPDYSTITAPLTNFDLAIPKPSQTSKGNEIGGAILAGFSDSPFVGGQTKNVNPSAKALGEGILGGVLDGSGDGKTKVGPSKFGSFGGGLFATSEKAGEVNKTSGQDLIEAIKEGTRVVESLKNSLEGTIRKGLDF